MYQVGIIVLQYWAFRFSIYSAVWSKIQPFGFEFIRLFGFGCIYKFVLYRYRWNNRSNKFPWSEYQTSSLFRSPLYFYSDPHCTCFIHIPSVAFIAVRLQISIESYRIVIESYRISIESYWISIESYGYIAACDKHVTDFFTDCSPGSVPHPLGDHRIVLHLAQTAVGGITETFGTLQSTLNIKYRSNIGKWGFRLETWQRGES